MPALCVGSVGEDAMLVGSAAHSSVPAARHLLAGEVFRGEVVTLGTFGQGDWEEGDLTGGLVLSFRSQIINHLESAVLSNCSHAQHLPFFFFFFTTLGELPKLIK